MPLVKIANAVLILQGLDGEWSLDFEVWWMGWGLGLCLLELC